MTPGVLLRKLGSDPELREFSHVMIDEARGGSVRWMGCMDGFMHVYVHR